MSQDSTGNSRLDYFRNWVSMAGGVVAAGSLFAFVLLVALNAMSKDGNPYLGILTYIIAPSFLIAGLCLVFFGWWWSRRQALKGVAPTATLSLTIDFSRSRDRKLLFIFGSGSLVFFLLTAFGSYQTYHFTESVEFCGKTCHFLMTPEFTAYHRSPHARVSCAECHIGGGASWYVKSKLSGAYQVYSTIFKKYSRPIPTPVHNLRPAQDTCEKCHWPEKFTGNLDRTYEHNLSDKKNTPFAVRLLLRVGGGQSGHGQFGGIHWHMSVSNKVEYYTTDERRQVIPWVRTTARDGKVTIYRAPDFKDEPPAAAIRTMDCMDCHNRPAHITQTANDVVEEKLAVGSASMDLPNIKRHGADALTRDYADTATAMTGIAEYLRAKYKDADKAKLEPTIVALQEGYRNNFFPEMKADWRGYPNNIGHKDWPGCFRCHDDKHVAADGVKIKASDCSTCHVIASQGRGEQLQQISTKGLEFKHPGGELDPELLCSDCHNGAVQK